MTAMGDSTTTEKNDGDGALSDMDAADVVRQYKKLVYKVAHKIQRNLPDEIELEDLVGWGYAGLLEAYQRYDETKSTRFASFAYYRIRGSILDACPEPILDQRRRLADTGCNEVLNTYAHVVHNHGGKAGIEDRLSMMSDIAGSLQMVFVLRDCPSEAMRPDKAPHQKRVERKQNAKMVHEALERLPKPERVVLQGVYFTKDSLTEIGDSLGYSASWVCRTHARALEKLRLIIEEQDDLEDLRHAIPI